MTLERRTQLHGTVNVVVGIDGRGRPGLVAFKHDGSILRTYRLGRLSYAPRWVRDVAADVVAGAA